MKIPLHTRTYIYVLHKKFIFFLTRSAVLAMYDEQPLSDGFAFVAVVVEQLHIAVVPPLVHNHCAFLRYKSMCDYR